MGCLRLVVSRSPTQLKLKTQVLNVEESPISSSLRAKSVQLQLHPYQMFQNQSKMPEVGERGSLLANQPPMVGQYVRRSMWFF